MELKKSNSDFVIPFKQDFNIILMQISKTQKSIKNAIIQTKKHLHQYKCKYKILLIFLLNKKKKI